MNDKLTDDKFEPLILKNQLCFALYACSREITRAYKPFLDGIGLTYTQYITMIVMWEHGEISVKEIGALLHLDSGTLTPLLKKLEQRGLITRKRGISDERVVMVALTDEGEKLRESALTVPKCMKERMCLSQKEVEQLYKTLYKILDSMAE